MTEQSVWLVVADNLPSSYGRESSQQLRENRRDSNQKKVCFNSVVETSTWPHRFILEHLRN